jgi:hypothetical protein
MDDTRTSQARDNAPNPPPFPPTLAEAIAALEIRVVEAVIMEEKPLMWISPIPVHRCFQRPMSR